MIGGMYADPAVGVPWVCAPGRRCPTGSSRRHARRTASSLVRPVMTVASVLVEIVDSVSSCVGRRLVLDHVVGERRVPSVIRGKPVDRELAVARR